MARPRNHRQFETLAESLAGSRKSTTAQGKIVPVPKRRNPYIQQINKGAARSSVQQAGRSALDGSSIATQLGVRAQEGRLAKPVSTQLDPMSYESDPILARIKAIGSKNVADAEAEATALRKQAILETGLADVGAGIGLDNSTLEAARNNPFSKAKSIALEAEQRGRELDESMNQGNLFYSGHRANQLGELARSRAESEARLGSDLRSLLAQIDSGVLNVKNQFAGQEQEALGEIGQAGMQNAYEQALLDSLAGGREPVSPWIQYGADALTDPAPLYMPSPMLPSPYVDDPYSNLLLRGLGGY